MHIVVIPRVMQILHLARHARHFYFPYRRDSHENSTNPWPNATTRLYPELVGSPVASFPVDDARFNLQTTIGVPVYIRWLPRCCSVGLATTVSMDRHGHHRCLFLHGLILSTRPLVRITFYLVIPNALHTPPEMLSRRTISRHRSTLHRFLQVN